MLDLAHLWMTKGSLIMLWSKVGSTFVWNRLLNHFCALKQKYNPEKNSTTVSQVLTIPYGQDNNNIRVCLFQETVSWMLVGSSCITIKLSFEFRALMPFYNPSSWWLCVQLNNIAQIGRYWNFIHLHMSYSVYLYGDAEYSFRHSTKLLSNEFIAHLYKTLCTIKSNILFSKWKH